MTPAEMSALERHCLGDGVASWTAQDYADFQTRPEAVLLTYGEVAILAGRVVADEAEIITVAVHPDHRRGGIALHLLSLFEDIARSRGAGSVFLEVDEANTGAMALYLGVGFSEVGRRRCYYRQRDGQATDALVMRRIVGATAP